jgi:FkbM family methyltransferase
MKVIAKKVLNKFGLEVRHLKAQNYKSENEIFIENIGIHLSEAKKKFLVNSLDLLKPLVEKVNAKFTLEDSDKLKIEINGLSMYVQTWEDLFIINEIFVSQIYNFVTEQPIVVWDIGMNVGIASLYFATKNNVVSVIGYEPIKDTYEQAKENFALNPLHLEKIRTHNLGIGKTNERLTVKYCYEWKGSIGINRFPDLGNNYEYVDREMHLINASDALDMITNEYPGVNVVAKIDCEGAEYDIVETLFISNKLKNLKAIMLEWHNKERNEELIELLCRAGFQLIYLNDKNDTNIGIIYATHCN